MAVFGFIGTGNMGGALATAAAKTLPGSEILLANRTAAKTEKLAEKLGCCASDSITVADTAKYIFLGVKPQMVEELMDEIRPVLTGRKDRFVLVSMIAGTDIERILELAGRNVPVIRIMPNTPASIGAGMILYCRSKDVTDEELNEFLDGMKAAGRFSPIAEKLIDAGSAVSGCGPAFVDLFIEALADGGVACGLPRKSAVEFAAQMVMGSAQLVLESGKHPGELKDAVCSPGGTTIQGVRILEQRGFRGAVTDAVIAAYEKTLTLK